MYQWSEEIIIQLEHRKYCLNELIAKLEKSLESAPSGNLRVSKSGKSFQYYLRENPKNKNGTYIPKAKIEIAKALAQRDYEKKALAYAKAELVNVTTYLAYMKVNNLISVLDSFGEGRQRLITPIYRMETDFVEA